MGEENRDNEHSVNTTSFVMTLVQGAGIAVIFYLCILIFLMGGVSNFYKQELTVGGTMALFGSIGGAIHYSLGFIRAQGTLLKISAYVVGVMAYLILVLLGFVLGMNN